MIDVAVRLIAAWLAHETYGVNAMTASLPHSRLGGGEDALPSAVPVYNDADDEGIARALSPKTLPAIAVWADSQDPVSEGPRQAEADATIAIGYFTKDSVNDLAQNRACGYLMRGVRRSLRNYAKGSLAEGYRELNGIRVMALSLGKEQRITMAGEGETPVMWGFLAVTARVADSVV